MLSLNVDPLCGRKIENVHRYDLWFISMKDIHSSTYSRIPKIKNKLSPILCQSSYHHKYIVILFGGK